ncbi:Uncharacterised protein [Collinsella intestinalis]|nr:Uncharacterised protein [Collinsella intestinalis]
MVLIALVTVEVVVIVRHVAVIVIHDQLGVVILGGRDDLDAAVAKELVNGGQLCISDVDVLEDDLDLILGDGTGLGSQVEQLLDGCVQSGTGACRLFRHRCSLLST